MSPEPAQAPAFEPAAPAPFAPAPPVDLGLPLPPPIPDFSQGLAAAIPTEAPQQQPAILGDILAPEPPTSLGLDYEATNTIPAPGTAYAFEAPAEQPPLPPATPPQPPAPGQFQIPGQ